MNASGSAIVQSVNVPSPPPSTLLEYALESYEILRSERLEKAFGKLWESCYDNMDSEFVESLWAPCPSQSVDVAVTWLNIYTESIACWIAEYAQDEDNVDEEVDAIDGRIEDYLLYTAGISYDHEQFVIVGTRDIEFLCEILENLNFENFMICASVLES